MFIMGESTMDFIEQWFGISPDGGSGATELLVIGVGASIVVAFLARRWIAHRVASGISRRSK